LQGKPDYTYDVGSPQYNWARKQRHAHSRGKLTPTQTASLQSLPDWSWDLLGSTWNQQYKKLEDWFFGLPFSKDRPCSFYPSMHPEIKGGTKEDNDPQRIAQDKELAKWILNQRQLHEHGKLPRERRDLLLRLPGWRWSSHSNSWEHNYQAVQRILCSQPGPTPGNSVVALLHDNKLIDWVHGQHSKFFNGTLSEERIGQLNALRGWTWCGDCDWEAKYREVRKFMDTPGVRYAGLTVRLRQFVVKYAAAALARKRLRCKTFIHMWLSSGKERSLRALPRWSTEGLQLGMSSSVSGATSSKPCPALADVKAPSCTPPAKRSRLDCALATPTVPGNASPFATSSSASHVVMLADSMGEMPADLRMRAKRGDEDIHLMS
jgi:hypothetical protein